MVQSKHIMDCGLSVSCPSSVLGIGHARRLKGQRFRIEAMGTAALGWGLWTQPTPPLQLCKKMRAGKRAKQKSGEKMLIEQERSVPFTRSVEQMEEVQPWKILYVDDNAQLRMLVSEMLLGAGYSVEIAEDGQAAWEALEKEEFDLLITDHQMPRLTGAELIKRLRAIGVTLPVVMASGTHRHREARQNAELGLAATLPKPFTPDELLETIQTVMRSKRAPSER